MHDLDFLDDLPLVEVDDEPRAVDPNDRLITAAFLAATAFRMKDASGLVHALRSLVAAVQHYQRQTGLG
ncbi:MAG: hypothetical protein AAFX81_07420 [Pseudomonadota bacterium]